MSAINEWFGYYNAVFTHIRRTYGQQELELYLEHIGKVAYSDIIETYKSGGLKEIRDHYVGNFQKDGEENSVTSKLTEQTLCLQVRCPAFHNSPPAAHPDRQVGPFFCDCCRKLNQQILKESGFDLQLTQDCPGDCVWTIQAQ